MRKFTISLLVFLVSASFLTQSVFSQACENFDSYNVGDYVAVVVPGWTTWSNNPGSGEDALITDVVANSPLNSFIIEGGTDLVQLFDAANITSGIWEYSNMMYVADGFTGYFNLQKDVVPGTEWGFQVMFDADGTATVDAGAAAASVFTFTFDEWHANMLIVDLDNDYAEYWFDGELMIAWAWSLGTFGTPGEMTLGGANYFANPGLGDPLAYYDDVCFDVYTPPAGGCDNFDSYVAGDFLCTQSDLWIPWSGTPGGADDAYVTDAEAQTPPNSVDIDASVMDSDILYDLGQTTAGVWAVSLEIMVPAGTNGGYWNIMQDMELFGAANEWGFQIFYKSDGTGYMYDADFTLVEFTYTVGEWTFSEVVIDLDNAWAELYIDNSLVYGWQWDIAGPNMLGAVDFYAAADGNDDPKYYIDSFCFLEVPPAEDCEDFDALTVGGYVAEQLGGYWTTWSGGSADDAMVTDAQSNSPDNSFVVDAGAVDLIFQLGDEPLSSGQWLYSHYIYVPTGFSGYFNVQTEPTPGVGWNLDLYFDDGGTGAFDGQSTETFVYDQDTWIMVEINYDLDAGMAQVLFDGVLMLEFVNTLTIGGIDYYGANSGGDPGAYYDDVCFGEGWEITGCENFDALTVGGYVAEQLGGYWTTWSGGSADDAMVTDAQSNSPDNSFVVDAGAVDLILQLGDEPLSSGQWLFSTYIYVPTGFSGYFNVQTEPTPGVGWNLDLYFDDGGTGAFDGQSTETFVYDQDTWIKVEINYDLDAGMGMVLFDGVYVLEFVNELTIGGIDFYGANSGGDPGAYYDDVCFGEGWPVGIEELDMSNLVVYPNPARDQITIASNNIIDEVRIYNNMGQLVYSGEFNNDQIMVNTSNFIHGMYIVQVRSGEAIEVRKLIIE